MASTKETSVDATNRECDTQNGYFWYLCTRNDLWYYAGCCRIDPCAHIPIGCPPRFEQDPLITTAFSTSTSISSTTGQKTLSQSLTDTSTVSSPSPTSSTTSPGSPASPIISSTSNADSDSSSHGLALSVGSIVGIAVGCGIAVIFASLMACMWWGRRRREKDEKRDHVERLASSRGLDEDHLPPGLDSVFNPMAQSGPGSIFDRAEGRMMKGESTLGLSPLVRDSRFSSGMHSGLIRPLTPASTFGTGLGLSLSPSELDSTPVHEVPAKVPELRGSPAELGSEAVAQEMVCKPRATLNSTQQERASGTYANSWARFQNVQL